MGGGWGGGWVAHVILVSAQVPIGPFDFGTAFGLGLGLGWTGIGIGTRAWQYYNFRHFYIFPSSEFTAGNDEAASDIDNSEDHIHDIEEQADQFEDHSDPI